MDTSALMEIGLTEIETKIYLALLELGPTTTGDIIKKTGLHKATIYQTLERLQEKGLVTYIIKVRAKYFQAASPSVLLEQLKQKEGNLKEILPALFEKEKAGKEKIKAEIVQGRKGIINIYRDLLRSKEYYSLGAGIPIMEILGPFYHQFQMVKRKKRIRAKILMSVRNRKPEITKTIYGVYKFLPEYFESPTNTIIYGNKIAIIVWSDLVGFVLESKDASKAYRKYFDALWRIAKQ